MSMLAATEAAQMRTAVVIIVILCGGALVMKKTFAAVAMAAGAAAGAKWITPLVKSEGNMINTDAAPMPGAILAGAVIALVLYAVVARRLA
jgi:hypothetical protein